MIAIVGAASKRGVVPDAADRVAEIAVGGPDLRRPRAQCSKGYPVGPVRTADPRLAFRDPRRIGVLGQVGVVEQRR